MLAKFTKVELEGIKTSLGAFHQEVYEAVEANEARLCDFNDMKDMQLEVLETIERCNRLSAECLPLLYE